MSTETHKSTVDKPLGHKDIRRAMSYAHVLRRGSLGLEVYRPLDFSVVTPFGIELISKLSRSRLSRRLGGPTARAGRVLGIGLSIHLAHFRLNLSPIIPPSTTQGGDYRHPGALLRIEPDSAAPALLQNPMTICSKTLRSRLRYRSMAAIASRMSRSLSLGSLIAGPPLEAHALGYAA
jgi:hypothetical protein